MKGKILYINDGIYMGTLILAGLKWWDGHHWDHFAKTCCLFNLRRTALMRLTRWLQVEVHSLKLAWMVHLTCARWTLTCSSPTKTSLLLLRTCLALLPQVNYLLLESKFAFFQFFSSRNWCFCWWIERVNILIFYGNDTQIYICVCVVYVA